MRATWNCPKCQRAFSRKGQRHACGTGDRAGVLKNRSDELVRLYTSIETFAKSLGSIEIVARKRYVLFRTVRIFADLVMMTDAVRLAVHLGRRVDRPIFFKVASDERHVTHVAKLRTEADFAAIQALLKEAYEFSLADRKGSRS